MIYSWNTMHKTGWKKSTWFMRFSWWLYIYFFFVKFEMLLSANGLQSWYFIASCKFGRIIGFCRFVPHLQTVIYSSGSSLILYSCSRLSSYSYRCMPCHKRIPARPNSWQDDDEETRRHSFRSPAEVRHKIPAVQSGSTDGKPTCGDF